ncbi:MAG: carboxypeptidase-like regulatory domain-containing protein, partial [Myxococcota bacterium]
MDAVETTSDTSAGNTDGPCTCDDATSTCPGTVTGTVTDIQSQQRLAGVVISGNQSGEAVETDTDGAYELEANVCRSPYILTATFPGYCERTDTLQVSGRRTINSDVQLEQRFVAGAVIDVTPSGATGNPVSEFIEGIRVSVSDTGIDDISDRSGGFLLEKLPGEGEVILIASEARPEGEGCYENKVIERVETCQGGPGVIIEMYCRDESNNGCGLCCTSARALPEGARPGDPCIREEPCAVGENPIWVCDADLGSATCSCNACPEDNSRGEICDGRDNDCDGTTDNPDSAVLLDACAELDGAFATSCVDGRCTYMCENGRGDVNGDIDAGAEGNGCECARSNGGVEVCDGLDNDCNGTVDDIPETLCDVQRGVCAGTLASCTEDAVLCRDED